MNDYLEGVETIYSVPIHVEDVGRFYLNYLLFPSRQEFISTEGKTPLSKDKKILVVDDSSLIRKMMKRYLQVLGYENILEAENGLEAILMDTTGDFIWIIR
jgi:PleD family two-component response regulator